MRIGVAIASSLLQLLYVFGLIEFVTTLLKTYQVITLHGPPDDPRMFAGLMSQTIVTFMLSVLPGLVGALLTWALLRRLKYKSRWFLSLTSFFAIAWMIFIPIGTILGVFMLRWKRAESHPQAAT